MTQTERTIQIPLPKLHVGQAEAKKQFKRFTVLAIGRRWGKTKMSLTLGCQDAIKGKKIAYIAPTHSMSTKWFKDCATRLMQITKSINSKDHILELVTGGSIQTFSMESINNIRGNDFDFIIHDEAAYMNNLLEEWNKAIRPTLVDRKGSAVFLSTPNGYNDFYALSEKCKKDTKNWATIQMTSHSNPFIPAEELDEVKESLPTEVYEREILAKFNDTSASIFKREWIQRIEEAPKDLAISFGVDLAISKSTSGDFTCIAVVGHDTIYNKYYLLALHRSQMSFNEIVTRITEMASLWNPQVIAIESVAFQRVVTETLLETTTLPVIGVHPVKDKVSRALPLATRFEKGDIFIVDSDSVDPELYNELLAFPNPKVHDDAIDAFEMGFTALSQTKPFVFSI